jgi:hypothetical protein
MAYKLGSVKHAKGFILNKLFEDERIGGRHLPIHLLQNGYPPKYRFLIGEAFQELKTDTPSLIHVENKRTGRDTSPHVCMVPSRVKKARGLINGYREAAKLPRYGQDMKTLLPVKRATKK